MAVNAAARAPDMPGGTHSLWPLGVFFRDACIRPFNNAHPLSKGNGYALNKRVGLAWCLQGGVHTPYPRWLGAIMSVLDFQIPRSRNNELFKEYVPSFRSETEEAYFATNQTPFSMPVDGTVYLVEPDTMLPTEPYLTPPGDEDVHQLAWICQRIRLEKWL